MCDCNRRGFIWGAASLGVFGAMATSALAQTAPRPKVYTCPPCGCPNDGKEFPEPGDCSVCAMPLAEKPAGAPPPEPKPPASERPPAG